MGRVKLAPLTLSRCARILKSVGGVVGGMGAIWMTRLVPFLVF